MGSVLNPVDLDIAIIESRLSKFEVARKAKVGVKTINKIYAQEYVRDRDANKLAEVLGLDGVDLPPPAFRLAEEDELCHELAMRLIQEGFKVEREWRLPSGRKADIVAWRRDELCYIVEAKVRDPLAGIGQLIADRIELKTNATLILLLPPQLARSTIVKQSCDFLNIEIWPSRPRPSIDELRSMMPNIE